MRNLFYVFFILLITAAFGSGSFAQDKKATEEVKKVVAEETVDDGKPVNTICPVSTEDVDGEITHSHNGKTYALCCKSCLKKFKADPEKYISRLSEDGKSIKKKK